MMDYISKLRIIKHNDVLGYEKRGMSDAQIALRYKLTRTGFGKIRKSMGWERKFGWERVDKGVARKSEAEKREKRNAYMRSYNRTNGIKHPQTRVGEKIIITSRLVAEDWLLGRAIGKDEIVHHKDGNTENNDPCNLLVFGSQGDHLAFHRGEEVSIVAFYRGLCFMCKKPVTLETFCLEGGGKFACTSCAMKYDKGREGAEEIEKALWKAGE